MNNISIDLSFKECNFFMSILDFINSHYKILKVEYSYNFQWLSVKKIEMLNGIHFDQVRIHLQNSGKLLLQKNNKNLHPRIYISELSISQFINILCEFEENYSSQIVNGFVCDNMDRILQNDNEIKFWKRKLGEIPSYVQVIANPQYKSGQPGMDMVVEELINIESLPGHFHLMDYDDMLWFGSCWQMYFSTVYYKYIPKPLFDDFHDCIENIILENGLRKITLYNNIEDFDLAENRHKQWAFRRATGIDSIAHELTKTNNRIEPSNLPVLITKKNCVFGQTRVIKFLDENNKLVSSDKAVKKLIQEYLEDGITVVFEDIDIII